MESGSGPVQGHTGRDGAVDGGVAAAFVCAMPMEARPLIRKLGLHPGRVADLRVHLGSMAGESVVVAVSGMGTSLATRAVTGLLDALSVDRVVVVGITGAVDASVRTGTLVMPEVVVDGATGTEHRPAPLGEHRPAGMMWTSDLVVVDEDSLADLRRRGVVALDMETAAVAAICEERGVPWSVFRAVSDHAGTGEIDEELFRLGDADGRPRLGAVAAYVARHPGRVPKLVKLVRGAEKAARTAAEEAIRASTGRGGS